MQLFIKPNGAVYPCSVHLIGYGNIADVRLGEIWNGVRRRDLVDRLAGGDYSAGCENCEAEISLEGWDTSYAAFFDIRAKHLTDDPETGRWPRWIDFNLSTSCNLQCIQCSGDLSSSIRIHREKRAPLPSPFDDQFFEDLREFIPHLHGALFAGGEPFMGAENFRVWDLIHELNPALSCTVTTNATQWNDRVRRELERLRFSFVFSLDGLTPDTFEAVRVGADHGEVFANVDRFTDYARSRGTLASVNHCLMVQNHHEFADLLMWAEGRGLPVAVSVVRTPASCSIARLPPDRLREVYAELLSRDAEVSDRLRLNASIWRTEVDRIRSWVESAEHVGSTRGVDSPTWGRTVLVFRCNGDRRHDDTAALDELRGDSVDGVVHVLDVGVDDLITDCSESLVQLLGSRGIDRNALVGQNFALIQDVAIDLFGPLRRYEVLAQTPDRLDAAGAYGDTELRISMVAMRDEHGLATTGRILVAVCGG